MLDVKLNHIREMLTAAPKATYAEIINALSEKGFKANTANISKVKKELGLSATPVNRESIGRKLTIRPITTTDLDAANNFRVAMGVSTKEAVDTLRTVQSLLDVPSIGSITRAIEATERLAAYSK